MVDVTTTFNNSKSDILHSMKNENMDLKKNQLELKELTEQLKKQLIDKEQYLMKIQ